MKLLYSILFCLIILKCAAQPGTLTTSFGANGKVLTDFTKGEDLSYGMAIQSDGKIVLAGETSNYPLTYTDFGVTRYNTKWLEATAEILLAAYSMLWQGIMPMGH